MRWTLMDYRIGISLTSNSISPPMKMDIGFSLVIISLLVHARTIMSVQANERDSCAPLSFNRNNMRPMINQYMYLQCLFHILLTIKPSPLQPVTYPGKMAPRGNTNNHIVLQSIMDICSETCQISQCRNQKCILSRYQ